MSWQEATFWTIAILFGFPFVICIAGLAIDALIVRAWRWLRGV